MIKLYHGSNIAIDRIDLTIGRKGKDFGQGFYLSPDLKQAQRMAQIAVEREGFGSPTVTTFLFDDSHLTDGSVRFKRFDAYTTDWARFIVANRQNRTSTPVHDFDIVYGPISISLVPNVLSNYCRNYDAAGTT